MKIYFQNTFPLQHLWWPAPVYKDCFIWIFMQINFSWIAIIDYHDICCFYLITEVATKSSLHKIGVLTIWASFWKYQWRNLFYSKFIECWQSPLSKQNSFTGIFNNFPEMLVFLFDIWRTSIQQNILVVTAYAINKNLFKEKYCSKDHFSDIVI